MWNADVCDRTMNLSEMEGSILLFIQNYMRNPVLDAVFRTITHLGDKGIFWVILTVLLLMFKRTRKAGVCSACALIGSLLVNNFILKNLFNRTRPYEVIEGLVCLIAPATDASFPSGHTGASFASAVAIYLQFAKICPLDGASLFRDHMRHSDKAGAAQDQSNLYLADEAGVLQNQPSPYKKYGVLLLILAALIAFSRLYVGIHYPTDVLGGLVTGVALGVLGDFLGERVFRNSCKKG